MCGKHVRTRGARRHPSVSTATCRTAGESSTPSRSCSMSVRRAPPSKVSFVRNGSRRPSLLWTRTVTDFAMALSRLLGFDLGPRLKELKQRHLFVPRRMKAPKIAAVCQASVDIALIKAHWDSLVHLAASMMLGRASAVTALARFGSAARGDPIYDAGIQLGKLLRMAFQPTISSTSVSGVSCDGCSTVAKR